MMKILVISMRLQIDIGTKILSFGFYRITTGVEDTRRIGETFASYYQNICGSSQNFCVKINWSNLLGSKTQHDLSSLDTLFSQEEIKRAVFDRKPDQAPGPDGLPILFFPKILGNCQE